VGIRDPSVLVTTGSATIGLLSDMKVLPDGTIVATDVLQNAILFVHPGGETSTIGRSGAGPGELSAPLALGVLADALAVWDARNGRVQILARDGEYLRSYPVGMADGTSPAWREDGWLAAPTMGMAPGLVRVRNPTGRETAIVGELLSPGSAIVDMGAAIADIRNERIPAFVRNAARTVWDAEGRLWIVPEAEPRLLRVALDGTVELDVEIEDAALAQIREAYFEQAREVAERGGVRPLRLYADAEAVGDELWLLLSHDSLSDPVILAISIETGEVRRRMVIPWSGALGPFAVDLDRHTLFVQARDEASLLAFELVNR
jgi:hypothetical protein